MNASCTRLAGKLAAHLAAALLAGLLAACGGGGDSPDSSPLADGFSRFTGIVTDSTGAPLEGADLRMPFANTVGWGGRTDATGYYSFDARVNDYAGVSPIAMTISKDGYRPRTVYFASLASNARYAFTTDAGTSPAKLKPEEFVPKGSTGLWHVGNDMFGGAVNSQLQTSSRGDGLAFEIGPWTSAMKAQYRTATVEFVARGVDSLDCRNFVAIGTGAVLAYQYLAGSDANGGFSRYRLLLDVSVMPADTTLTAFVKSGDCPSSPSDPLDDFEFSELLVTFGA